MKGRVCREHCRFDSQKQQWRQLYDPIHVCAQQRCSFCSILQKELSRSRGNVFYDVKISTKVSGNGLFPDEYPVQIIKGKKFLEHPVSMDICRIIARWFQREIIEREEGHYRRELFFAQHHGQYFQLEVLNIRAERRETRDEAQDLAEREAGYTVTHHSDQEKALREDKRARREERLQATIRRHLTNVTQHGLDGLETSDRIRIDRLIERGLLKQEELAEAQNDLQRRNCLNSSNFANYLPILLTKTAINCIITVENRKGETIMIDKYYLIKYVYNTPELTSNVFWFCDGALRGVLAGFATSTPRHRRVYRL